MARVGDLPIGSVIPAYVHYVRILERQTHNVLALELCKPFSQKAKISVACEVVTCTPTCEQCQLEYIEYRIEKQYEATESKTGV